MGKKRRKHDGSGSSRSPSPDRIREARNPSQAEVAGFRAPPSGKPAMTVKQLREERQKLLHEHFGYSNTNNPFGDRLLAEPFVWKKKNQLLQAAGQKGKTTVAALIHSSKSKVQEIENVKRRREEREKEEELMQQQREELQREKEREHYEEYAQKEELFHRSNQLKKTEIRLEQNRAQLIDLIVKGLRIIKGERFEKMDVLPGPPHEVLETYKNEPVTVAMLEDLIADVKLHIDVDTTVVDADFQDFWKSLLVLAREALERAKKRKDVLDQLARNSSPQMAAEAAAQLADTVCPQIRDADTGIVLSVAHEVEGLLGGKSAAELDELEAQIRSKFEEEDIDVAYWEGILNKIPSFRARAVCLQTWHMMTQSAADAEREMAREKALKEEEEAKAARAKGEELEGLLLEEADARKLARAQQIKQDAIKVARSVEKDVNPNADGSFSPELEPYDEGEVPPPVRGPYSPQLWPFDEFRHAEILAPDDDEDRRANLKKTLIQKERLKRAGLEEDPEPTPEAAENDASLDVLDPAAKVTTYEEFVKKEKKNLEADEEVMASSSEHKLTMHYTWEEKYRPRKPRFFNRVKTGYSWNKYNTTHYDHDNPPPKVVQGYKFNIFYPDLIDKTKAPTWFLEPSDTPDTVIIRFHAGPPYEDIAFKILNQEWQLERFRGFRNVFDRGIMQLYFSFKRYIYRR
ncbi:cactin [Toxoplasma gondii ME49]|uniref:Splicing factor Cactin n=2 Tax=Toxoplasma gondii TaxID=5811 RepID=S8GPP8_TOXGM|nr:cactin [Toxoplasma gondii ME49]EPT30559.1 cactin [Toxoplasma gondii ME49]KYF40938.1 cactin [Toxoplasma gondii ARI]|eukprot:XP_018637550.1 cactin [Toxoplasma gondii ME49]